MMMTERWPLVARLKRWSGNVTIGFGVVAVFLTVVAGLAAVALVFSAAGRLVTSWWQYYPK